MEDTKEVARLFQHGVMMQTRRAASRRVQRITEKFHPAAFSWRALGLEVAG